MTSKKVAIIGGGAAGIFCAIQCALLDSHCQVHVFEKTMQPLSKVRISGGGRCNVTHHCFDPKRLSQNYPRGENILKKLFYHFHPEQLMEWFAERGVELKVEVDGRVFPVSNSSQTIISCFLEQAEKLGVKIHLGTEILDMVKGSDGIFTLSLKNGENLCFSHVVMATGGVAKAYSLIQRLGHKMVEPLPSLFTFQIHSPILADLSGISLPVKLHVASVGEEEGPMLITHVGVSGPAVLRMSAWGARILAEVDYQFPLTVNWVPGLQEMQLREALLKEKSLSSTKTIVSTALFSIPKNLWKKLVLAAGMDIELLWAQLSHKQIHQLIQTLQRTIFQVKGKSPFKEEFVTAGGVPWKEIDYKTMQSKLVPHLYFAGEVVNSDGITGGFNFQHAWTTAWVAAHAIGKDNTF